MELLRNLTASIRAKLFLGFIGIAVIALLAGLFSMIPFIRLEGAMQQIGHGNLGSLIRISTIKDSLAAIMSAERTLLIRQLSDQEIRNSNYQIIDRAFADAEEAGRGLASLNLAPEQEAAWHAFQTDWDSWQAKQQELLDILRSQEALLEQGIRGGRQFERIANQAFDLAFTELHPIRVRANEKLNVLVDMIRASAVQAVDDTLFSAQTSFRWQAVFLFVAFALSLLFGLWLSQRISKPILKSVGYIARVADGNLSRNVDRDLLGLRGEIGLLSSAVQKLIESQRIEVGVFKAIADGDYTNSVDMRSSQDELGHAVGQMIDVTNDTLTQVNHAVYQVTFGASAINNASQTLSRGAIETASSLEEISASISQIGAKTKANAASADEADRLAASSRTAIDKGYHAVAEMISAMKDIQNISAQIASVVKLIDDIAFQTNLLALNAAVEAARAGRHGRGFSIVADEVRSLAGRSAKAAKETAQMLEITVAKLAKGSDLAEHTDSVLREIVANAARVESLFREIAKSSNEQSQGIGQIANGLSQIDRVTQHNTLTAGETASAANSLFRQAEALRTLMTRFRFRDSGAAEGQAEVDSGRRGDVRELPAPDAVSSLSLPPSPSSGSRYLP